MILATAPDSQTTPNRRIRRSPACRHAFEKLRAYVLNEVVPLAPLDWKRRVVDAVLERICHGQPQPVSTRHLRWTSKLRGSGGGRRWTDRPSYGTVDRVLTMLKGLGVLDWERCEPCTRPEYLAGTSKDARSPARVLVLTGRAAAIVAAALVAAWIPALHSGPLSLPSRSPGIRSAMGAGAAAPLISSAEQPPGAVAKETARAMLRGWLDRQT